MATKADWNKRRLELIQRKYGEGLTEEEKQELTKLQALADKIVESVVTIDPDRLEELRSKFAEIMAAIK